MKRKASSRSSSSKRLRTQYATLDDLRWKAVERPLVTGLDGDDGILELEEVNDVEVVYEDTLAGKVPRFRVRENCEGSIDDLEEMEEEVVDIEGTLSTTPTFDGELLYVKWESMPLNSQLKRYLHSVGFTTPSTIQSRSIPLALEGRDVIGIAQTGSGKTLAYGLPILHYFLEHNVRRRSGDKRSLGALVLAPTRELALQVSSHLNACLDLIESEARAQIGKSMPKPPPLVSVAAVVGGISIAKHRRILDRGVDVLVATPGRLWDIVQDDNDLANEIKHIKFLVLDEADRMIEAGHFAELDNILRLTLRDQQSVHFFVSISPSDEIPADHSPTAGSMQTFVFSATMSKDLQRNLKRRSKVRGKNYRKNKPASTIDDLLLRVDFRDADPQIVDVSPAHGVVFQLQESKIECLMTDKDAYLYYFLLRYPGRSLVFLTAIDGIRRLCPILELLEISVWPLHSQLEQRQRLKNLDRFRNTPNSVLLATDIAARGLDIPSVDHVVHYQIPRFADVYVHRNGRTARAMREGFSMLMCAPDERQILRALLGSLGRQTTDIPEMTIERGILKKLKDRVQLARQIDAAHHKVKKEKHDRKWMREAAEALEVDLDTDFDRQAIGTFDRDGQTHAKRQKMDAKNMQLRQELKKLLSRPLVAQGISTKYITSGSRPIADDLISGQGHPSIIGVKQGNARNDVMSSKTKKTPKKAPVDEDKWAGIGVES
ncbi:ATP-dependent RNA helicase [Fistulina hepatica ATCC 64428]|uniref:RNA helicase n=1 Tax=Fistulina hepatica ATCC 64428 TaxID=1128425 RepID=A0A0D7A994_9AGAR|nr:ATP-dependent RNA helicase [Fistulina hepatica ATCC 64428]